MSEIRKLADGAFRIWDTMAPEMDMVILFHDVSEGDPSLSGEVQDAFDTWHSEEGAEYARGDWVRMKLEEKHEKDSFSLFYSEEWDKEEHDGDCSNGAGKEELMTITRKCPMCGRSYQMTLTEREAELYALYIAGYGMIQDVFPELNPMEREFLNPRSGYCPECQTVLFGTEYTSERITPVSGPAE